MKATKVLSVLGQYVASFLLSAPLCGFVGGMIICEGCEGDISNRLLMGGIHAFLSTIGFGRLYVGNTGDMTSISLLPCMIPVSLVIFGGLMFVQFRKHNAIQVTRRGSS